MIANPVSILITDDDLSFRQTVRSVIEPIGFRTLEASDGQEALDVLRQTPVHLLLLDMHMPRLTGLETIRQVKQLNAMLPCILMSARADAQLIEQALLAQAFAVLAKPMTRQSIVEHVQKALQRAYGLSDDYLALHFPRLSA